MKIAGNDILATLAFLFVALYSCDSNKAKENPVVKASDSTVCGRYINITFLNTVKDKLPEQIPVYCYEMNFFSDDSVEIFYGFESGKLAYKKRGDDFALIYASFKGDMHFTVHDSILTLKDTAWTGITGFSEFRKIPDDGSGRSFFDRYFYEKIIAGDYQLFKMGEKDGKKVTFKSDGGVTGLLNYTRYDVCYSGDCIGTSSEPAYIISFYGTDTAEDYAFAIDKKNAEISFFELAPPIKDIKGDRPIKNKVFTLKKQ